MIADDFRERSLVVRLEIAAVDDGDARACLAENLRGSERREHHRPDRQYRDRLLRVASGRIGATKDFPRRVSNGFDLGGWRHHVRRRIARIS